MTSRHHFYTGLGILAALTLVAVVKLVALAGGWINFLAYTSAGLATIAFIPWAIAQHKLDKETP